MVTDTRCKCCDLLPGQCGKKKQQIQELEARATRAALVKGLIRSPIKWFPSMHAGVCVRCNEAFREETYISRNTIGSGYIAECCAEGNH